MKTNTPTLPLLGALGLLLMQGCSQHHSLYSAQNHQPEFYAKPGENGFEINHERRTDHWHAAGLDCKSREQFAMPVNYRVDQPLTLDSSIAPISPITNEHDLHSIPLSPGDLVELVLDNGEGFNGRYIVDISGFIQLPMLKPIRAAGFPANEVAKNIEMALIKAEIFHAASAMVSLQVLQWSDIEVSVTGAVFEPGQVMINRMRANNVQKERTTAYGDYSPKRFLSEAIRSASGVRPDAKLDQVFLIRNGWKVEVDLTGILSGQAVKEYPLIAGDQVIVPSTGCFQKYLVRPSQITPKGFRVFVSNLVEKVDTRGIGKYDSNVPYGTRLLQMAMSADCIGGKKWTNAPRKVVLATRHPVTQEAQVLERSVEELLRMPYRDDINPFLMPNDAIACYDSDVQNLRDVAKAIVEIVDPFKVL